MARRITHLFVWPNSTTCLIEARARTYQSSVYPWEVTCKRCLREMARKRERRARLLEIHRQAYTSDELRKAGA
jgi:hypothetical protein